jgi:hypothetical protein
MQEGHNKVMRIFIFLSLFFSFTAQAHVIGDEDWCVQVTEFHLVCLYKTSGDCEKALGKVKNNSIDFSGSSASNPYSVQKDGEGKVIPPRCRMNSKNIKPISV